MLRRQAVLYKGKVIIMQAQLREKNDIKIFILYLLLKIDQPMEFADINDIVVQDGVVGPIEFAECFAELLDMGNVLELVEDGKAYYVISEKGAHVAENLESELLGFIKSKSLKSALRLISFKNGGNRIESTYHPRADGQFDFTCRIMKRDDIILEINLLVENEKQLELMKYNFDDRPEVVYRGVMALLTGEIDFLLS